MTRSNVFGDLVRRGRTARGISLRTLGEQIGFSVAYLSGIENGKRPPFSEPATLIHLAKLLGLNEAELVHAADVSRGSFTLPQASDKHNEVAAQLVGRWSSLTDEQVGRIGQILSSEAPSS
jgi:transcriptional regulator with XRE-family HTH domain